MEKILEIKNLKKTFYKDRKPYVAVDDISFYVEEGSCVGIVVRAAVGKVRQRK